MKYLVILFLFLLLFFYLYKKNNKKVYNSIYLNTTPLKLEGISVYDKNFTCIVNNIIKNYLSLLTTTNKFIIIIQDTDNILLYTSLLLLLIENDSKQIIIIKYKDILTYEKILKLQKTENSLIGIDNNKIIECDKLSIKEPKIYFLKNTISKDIEVQKIYPNMIIKTFAKYIIIDNKYNYEYEIFDINKNDNVYIYEINSNSKINSTDIVYSKLLFILSNININNNFSLLDELMDTNFRGELSFKTI